MEANGLLISVSWISTITAILFPSVESAASTAATNTIIVGAGMSGIMAAKTLSENGVEDFLILEATNRIGGRMLKQAFAGHTIEVGANWVEGVGGAHLNPIWELAQNSQLRVFYSDYSNASFNIYGHNGTLLPQSAVAAPYELAIASSEYSSNLAALLKRNGEEDISILASQRLFGHVPASPLEMAIDYFFYDSEIAEPPRVTSLKNVEPIPTFTYFGKDRYFVADSRGYEYLVHNLAEKFLKFDNGSISDDRLKLKKVVREIQYSTNGVKILVEDGSVYNANHVILSVSLGVLQSKLIKFQPNLPRWKILSIFKFDMVIFTKMYLKFPYKFWPSGPGTESFIYADERRGYYTVWKHLENEYPGSNILLVSVTDDEARRIEQQPDHETKAEAMAILRRMFGIQIPEAEEIFIPRWLKDPFYRGTYCNWPIGVTADDFDELKAPVGRVYFTGEHTSEKFNGYVHGAYLAGIDTANMLLDFMKMGCSDQKSPGEIPVKEM